MNWLFRFFRKRPKPIEPPQRISVLDEIIYSDWYKPKKHHEHKDPKRTPGQDKK
jgi:hypothetical protein